MAKECGRTHKVGRLQITYLHVSSLQKATMRVMRWSPGRGLAPLPGMTPVRHGQPRWGREIGA